MDEKVKFNSEKEILVESKTMCTGAKQFGMQKAKALDF